MNKKFFFNINLGDRIKKFRLFNKLTIKDVQTIFYSLNHPISFQGIYKWEDGTVIPTLEEIFILCEIFNITVTTLLKDQSPKRPCVSNLEIEFLHAFRQDKNFKKLITMLYKKEVSNNENIRTSIKNSKKN